MCIINLSKISDFRENLLHMLLFWILMLLDSYACSYKNRGCRMCDSPFFSFYHYPSAPGVYLIAAYNWATKM